MPDEQDKISLSRVRYSHAEECLREAESLLAREQYKGAANRSYYAVFHGIRAVLALDGIDRKHHSGVIAEFLRLYVRTEIFDKRFSKMISAQYEYRTSSDYDDFFVISKAEVSEQIMNAQEFLGMVSVYLSGRYDGSEERRP